MEKLGEESAAKFINALIKSVQTLCHGYLDFQNGVEIIGHINLNVDKGSSLDYILKEKVCKNAENSTLFISNSFHAEPKPEQDVSGKASQSGSQVSQNNESSDPVETGKVSSAISSISSALTESRERTRRNSGARDSNSSHSLPNTAKRKASEEENSDCHPAKISYHDRLSQITSESSYPAETSSPVDSKEALLALRTAESDLSETVLPQTASVRSDGSDIGVNLAGSVLEPVDGQINPELPEREEDSDGDLEVTFIKEEYVEGEGSACDFDGQQFPRGQHQRASDGMPDPSLFSMGPQSSSASATYVPSAAGQQFPGSNSASSASQPQPGPSGMRGLNLQYSASVKVHQESFCEGTNRSPPLVDIQPGTAPELAQWTDSFGMLSLDKDLKERLYSGDCGTPGSVSSILLCEFCDKSFTSKSGLSKHKNSVHFHFKKKPYNCVVCGKGFIQKEHFEGHMNMHNNVKAYQCDVCFREFVYRTSLNQHRRYGVCKKRAWSAASKKN